MAKRASKPQDPRTPEEIAAQPRTKGAKQPGIVGARKKVAATKKEKKEKGAAIEAAAAPKRKKSTPSVVPTTAVKPGGGSRELLEPEEMKKKFKQTPVPDVDDPSTRGKAKRQADKARLAQIGNPDALTDAERKTMATPVVPVTITSEPTSPAESLRSRLADPLPDNVRDPFATSGAFTFQGPKPSAGGEVPIKDRQSYDGKPKVAKDLVRRMKKGMGLPGTKSLKERSLEIATKTHERQVELGVAHPLDAPTIDTPHVSTGPSMRQAVVEHMYKTDEESLRKYASSKRMSTGDTVDGLFKLRQESDYANARVKLGDEKQPVLYDASVEARPEKGFDVDFATFLTADVKKPRPAVSNRKRTHLVAQNIVEEITGPKRSGRYSGKSKGGITPFGPRELDNSLNRSSVDNPYLGDTTIPGAGKSPTGDLARSGAGKYAPKVVKDLPVKPGKKAPGIYTSAAKDSEGGLLPTPTRLQKVVRTNKTATGVSSPTYRLTGPTQEIKELEKNKMEQLDTPPSTRFVAKEQEKQRKSKGRLAMAIKGGDDDNIQTAAWKHRGTQFTQTTFEGMEDQGKLAASLAAKPVTSYVDVETKETGKRLPLSTKLPKPEKYEDAIKTIPYSSGLVTDIGFDRPQFATAVGGTVKKEIQRVPKNKPYVERATIESDGKKVVTGKGGTVGGGSGGYEQPFLTPSLSEAKLRERFPKDFDTSGGKPKTTWNPMSRQFLGNNEVPVSKETSELQSQASKARGKKDTPFGNNNDTSASLEAAAAETKSSYPKPQYPKVSRG
jgi:hypothetical protein